MGGAASGRWAGQQVARTSERQGGAVWVRGMSARLRTRRMTCRLDAEGERESRGREGKERKREREGGRSRERESETRVRARETREGERERGRGREGEGEGERGREGESGERDFMTVFKKSLTTLSVRLAHAWTRTVCPA